MTTCKASAKIFLAGEDLDWTKKRCLMFAIPLFTTVSISKSRNITIRQRGHEDKIESLEEFAYTGKFNDYINAGLHLWNREICSVEDIRIDITSDIPVTAGLGSSAAVLNALFGALSDYYHADVDVCNLGYRTEHDIIGAVVGSVDFYISQSSGVMLYDNSEDDVKISFLNHTLRDIDLLLLFSGNKSNTALINKDKMERYQRQEKNFMKYLRLTDKLVVEGAKTVENGNLEQLGTIITSAHNLMRRYLMNSTDDIDQMVILCNEYGALGSKLTGCGKGGYVYSLIEKNKADILCEELKDRRLQFMRLHL